MLVTFRILVFVKWNLYVKKEHQKLNNICEVYISDQYSLQVITPINKEIRWFSRIFYLVWRGTLVTSQVFVFVHWNLYVKKELEKLNKMCEIHISDWYSLHGITGKQMNPVKIENFSRFQRGTLVILWVSVFVRWNLHV